MLEIVFDNKFKKEYRRALKRGCKAEKMEHILDILANEKVMPAKYKDHALTNSRELCYTIYAMKLNPPAEAGGFSVLCYSVSRSWAI